MLEPLPIPPPEGWTLDDAAKRICLFEYADWTFWRTKLAEAPAMPKWSTPSWPRFAPPIDQSEWVEQEQRIAARKAADALQSLVTAFRREMAKGEWLGEGRLGTPANPKQPISPDQWDAFRSVDFDQNEVADANEGGTRYFSVRITYSQASAAHPAEQVRPPSSIQKKKPGRPKKTVTEQEEIADVIITLWQDGEAGRDLSAKTLAPIVRKKLGWKRSWGEDHPSMSNIQKALKLAREKCQE